MWKVILVILAMSPAHELLQFEEFEMKTVDDCIANVEYFMKNVPTYEHNIGDRNVYWAGCRLEPLTPA